MWQSSLTAFLSHWACSELLGTSWPGSSGIRGILRLGGGRRWQTEGRRSGDFQQRLTSTRHARMRVSRDGWSKNNTATFDYGRQRQGTTGSIRLGESNDPQPIPERKGDIRIRLAHVWTRWVTYIFLLNLGLESNNNGSEKASRRHIESQTSSSGVKSFTMLKSFLISSGVLPLIMLATVLHPTSLRNSVKKPNTPLAPRKTAHSRGLMSR